MIYILQAGPFAMSNNWLVPEGVISLPIQKDFLRGQNIIVPRKFKNIYNINIDVKLW